MRQELRFGPEFLLSERPYIAADATGVTEAILVEGR